MSGKQRISALFKQIRSFAAGACTEVWFRRRLRRLYDGL